jgi:lipopolysaccharide cholinephosphotransferase
MDHFSESYGFGEYKSQAIKLLKTTIDILNEFEINHFLISGTLLGYIRHNDFIPWDDDIDILVDESILKKKELIARKYGNINLFFTSKFDAVKICFSNGLEIPDDKWKDKYIPGLFPIQKKYCFPFIDMFIYGSGFGTHICGSDGEITINGESKTIFLPFSGACNRCFRFIPEHQIVFFHNDWYKKDFFPPKQVDFLGIKCNIPNNPHKFLKNNFGENYMTVIESPTRLHKNNIELKDIIKTTYDRS